MEHETAKHTHRSCMHCHLAGIEFGLLLLFIGVFLIAKEMGWVHLSVSFLPLFLTLLGILLVAKSTGKG